MPDALTPRKPNRYSVIIEKIFFSHYLPKTKQFDFSRTEIISTAENLGIVLPKNIGDLIYTFRYRHELPKAIIETAADGQEWIIEGSGQALYRFKQVKLNRIEPRDELLTIKIPDSTPEIIGAYALTDEQALLAKVRYNRLIDIFLGITA
ncbi:MAG: hypothetical protein U0989_07535 [Azonexus sp.]|nr:hypothetical protein [Azonexus sp.]